MGAVDSTQMGGGLEVTDKKLASARILGLFTKTKLMTNT